MRVTTYLTNPTGPVLGLPNQTGTNNCWMNSSFQLACNLPAYREGLSRLPESQSLLEAQAKTSAKTHAYVVLSYLLIGVGIMLAGLSFYFATFIHPMIAMSSPALPIALGVLGIQTQGDAEKGENLSGNFPLLSAFNQYQQEQENQASISSVSTQKLREWLYDATAKEGEDRILSVTSRDGRSQEDAMVFFHHFLTQTKQLLPTIVQTGVRRSKWFRTELSRNQTNLPPESYLQLELNQFIDRPVVTAQQLFDSFFHFKSTGDTGSNEVSRQFASPPDHFTLQLKRFHKEYNLEGVVQSETKVETLVEGLARYTAPAATFGAKTEYETDGFIVHLGNTANGGHYVSYVKVNGQWWEGNDSSAKMITHSEADKWMQQAYIVHMQKVATT